MNKRNHIDERASDVNGGQYIQTNPSYNSGYEDGKKAGKEYCASEIKSLREQVEKLTKERDALVNAIDNEMVVTHMGVFNLGDDPKVALNKICCYAQDLGKFFAEDACKEQLAALAEQNGKMASCLNKLLDISQVSHISSATVESICRATISTNNLATPVLNRIRAEGMRMAAEILIDPMDRAAAQKICAQADELEKQNG